MSEGLDFADGNARAVLVVGIPYPHIKDRKVRAPSAPRRFCMFTTTASNCPCECQGDSTVRLHRQVCVPGRWP